MTALVCVVAAVIDGFLTRRLINAPDGIRAAKIAGRWLVAEEDLDAFLDAQANRKPARRRRRRAS